MAIIPIASILAAHYPAFQQVCAGRLPNTYAEWSQSEERDHRGEVVSGHTIVPIKIEPSELARYCEETVCQADSMALSHLAYKKWREQQLRAS